MGVGRRLSGRTPVGLPADRHRPAPPNVKLPAAENRKVGYPIGLRIILTTLFLVCLAAGAAGNPDPRDTVTSEIDWGTGTMLVTIERSLNAAGATGPAAVSRTQRAIRRDAAQILFDVLLDVRLDSLHTVGSLIGEREDLVFRLERAAGSATPIDASATRDLSAARVTFSVDLHRGLARQFVFHSRAASIESRLGWIAHTDYTGILIHAAGELPLFGTNTTARLEPALFPAVHYLRGPENLLYRLATAEHMDPDLLGSKGAAAYTNDPQATGHADRVGTRPLRILAAGTFGTAATDIVITEQDALQIMASAHNRSLLRDGKLVIVID